MQSWGYVQFRGGFAIPTLTIDRYPPKVAILGWVRLFNSTIIFEQFRQLAVAAKSCINVQICKIKTNIEIIMQKLATVTVSSYLWGEIKLEDTAQRCLLMLEVMTAAEWACAHYAEIPIITGFVPATINSDRVQIWSPVQHLHHVTTGHICPSHLRLIQSSIRLDATGAHKKWMILCPILCWLFCCFPVFHKELGTIVNLSI